MNSEVKATGSMRRTQVRDVFRRHKGEQSALAARLGKSPTAIWQVLNGKSKSELIMAAAEQRALELIAAEQQQEGRAA